MATIPEGGIEIKDAVIAVNGTPTNETIARLHDFLIYRGIAEESIWAYDGQDIGQMEVSNEAELLAEYQKVMAGHYAEYKQEYDEAKKNSNVNVTRPHYRRWVLHKVTG